MPKSVSAMTAMHREHPAGAKAFNAKIIVKHIL
jgi:hypothetical protein